MTKEARWYESAIPNEMREQERMEQERAKQRTERLFLYRPFFEALDRAYKDPQNPTQLLRELNDGLNLNGGLYQPTDSIERLPGHGANRPKENAYGDFVKYIDYIQTRDREKPVKREFAYFGGWPNNNIDWTEAIETSFQNSMWALAWNATASEECLHGYPISEDLAIRLGITDDGEQYWVASEARTPAFEVEEKSGFLGLGKKIVSIPVGEVGLRETYQWTDGIDIEVLKSLLLETVNRPSRISVRHIEPPSPTPYIGGGGGGGHGCGGYGCGH